MVRRSSLIVWIPVIATLAACEPATAPTEPVAQASTSSSAPSHRVTTFTWPGEHEDSPALPFPSAADAVTFLSEYMDADIALPTSLPSNVRLDVGTTVYVSTVDGVRRTRWRARTTR